MAAAAISNAIRARVSPSITLNIESLLKDSLPREGDLDFDPNHHAPGMAAYVTSKHGVVGMCKQLAIELAPQNIRVLGVAPTFCKTEGLSRMAAVGII